MNIGLFVERTQGATVVVVQLLGLPGGIVCGLFGLACSFFLRLFCLFAGISHFGRCLGLTQ